MSWWGAAVPQSCQPWCQGERGHWGVLHQPLNAASCMERASLLVQNSLAGMSHMTAPSYPLIQEAQPAMLSEWGEQGSHEQQN